MRGTPIFQAIVSHGKLAIYYPDRFREYLHGLTGEVEVIVRRRKKDRSNKQNRYQWYVFELIGDHLGWDKSEVHDYVKWRFFGEPDEATGLWKPGRTSSASTVEHNKAMEEIRRWAAMGFPDEQGEIGDNPGIYIPEPNEVELD